jgi:plasmid stabilization system protein ParE
MEPEIRLMPLRLSRTREADRQISEALRWWRRNREKAPSLLSAELRLAYQLMGEYPEAGALIEDAELPDIRRLSLAKTSFYLFYRVLPDRIVIVALWHQSRGEGPSF